METVIILASALALDILLGEPPDRWHPVAWLGRLIKLEMKLAPVSGQRRQFAWGVLSVTLTAAALAAAAFFLLAFLRGLHPALFIAAAAVMLKFTISLRGLAAAALKVGGLLAAAKTPEARSSLRALVSRDTATLDESQLIAATVASVAENSCDGVTAPLFYFALFGPAGAIAYRIVNTFDAMVGYRGEYEYLGKFAARLDDAANFIPARLTALIIVFAAWCCRRSCRGAWRVMRRDHRRTPSPNGGWTMSAMAGALGLKLEKAGCYRLGNDGGTAAITAINASLKLVYVATAVWCAATIIIMVFYYA